MKPAEDFINGLKWRAGNISALRIRERVTEPYIVRGSYQILANIITSNLVFIGTPSS